MMNKYEILTIDKIGIAHVYEITAVDFASVLILIPVPIKQILKIELTGATDKQILD